MLEEPRRGEPDHSNRKTHQGDEGIEDIVLVGSHPSPGRVLDRSAGVSVRRDSQDSQLQIRFAGVYYAQRESFCGLTRQTVRAFHSPPRFSIPDITDTAVRDRWLTQARSSRNPGEGAIRAAQVVGWARWQGSFVGE